MNEESKIVRLLQEAKPRETGQSRSQVMFVSILIAVIVTTGTTYLFMSSKVSHTESLVSDARAESAGFQADLYEKDAEIARLRDVQMYAAQMPIENLSIKNRDGLLRVSGLVKNLGRRAVDDIELKAFVVDENGTVISEQRHTARSPDGKPLYRWQRRRFHFEIPVPPGGEDVHVVITGIEFE